MENNNFETNSNKYFVPPTHLEQNENSNNLTNPSAYQYEDQIGTSSYDPIAINPIKNNRKIELNENQTTNNIKIINLKNNSKVKPKNLNLFQQNPSTTNKFNNLIIKLKEQSKPNNIFAINLKDSSKKKNEFLNKKTKKYSEFIPFKDSPYGKQFNLLEKFDEEWYDEFEDKTKDPVKNKIIDIILKENLSYKINALVTDAKIFYNSLCNKNLVDENGGLLIFNDKEKNKNDINTYYEIKKLRKEYENFIIENELYLISENLSELVKEIKPEINLKNLKKETNQSYNELISSEKNYEEEYEENSEEDIDDPFYGDLEIEMNTNHKEKNKKEDEQSFNELNINKKNESNESKSEDKKKLNEYVGDLVIEIKNDQKENHNEEEQYKKPSYYKSKFKNSFTHLTVTLKNELIRLENSILISNYKKNEAQKLKKEIESFNIDVQNFYYDILYNEEKKVDEKGNLINLNNLQQAKYNAFIKSKDNLIEKCNNLKTTQEKIEEETKFKENYNEEEYYQNDEYDGYDELLEAIQNENSYSYYKKYYKKHFSKNINTDIKKISRRFKNIKNIMNQQDLEEYSNLLEKIRYIRLENFYIFRRCVNNKEVNLLGEIFNNEKAKNKIERNISSIHDCLTLIDSNFEKLEAKKAKLNEENNKSLQQETLDIFLKEMKIKNNNLK